MTDPRHQMQIWNEDKKYEQTLSLFRATKKIALEGENAIVYLQVLFESQQGCLCITYTRT